MHNQNNRKLKTLALSIGIYVLLGGDAYAQQAWNLQLEPMYMGVAGTDNHMANITTTTTTYSSVFSPSPPPYGSYSSTYTNSTATTSQNFDMGGNGTFRGQLEFMPIDWGVGVSGWWFDTSDSINLNLGSSPTPSYYSPVTTYTTINYTSNNFSFTAPPASSGSVLMASANSSLDLWNVDAYGIKMLGESENGRINMTFGAKFGSIDSKVSEVVNGGSPIINIGGYSSSESGSATNSANASFLVGPSVGVQGLGKYGNHRLEGFLSQSVLIGNVDCNTIASRQYSYSYPSYYYPYTSSNIYNTSLSDSETIAIPVTEMKIKYLYDLTENLSLGLGFFGSLWVDTPMVPAAQFNDRQYKTLFFYGGLASINLRY